jgi:hypothetical protein
MNSTPAACKARRTAMPRGDVLGPHCGAQLERYSSEPADINTITADARYSYAKVYGALERRGIYGLIPTKVEPFRSPVPLRRFQYAAN